MQHTSDTIVSYQLQKFTVGFICILDKIIGFGVYSFIHTNELNYFNSYNGYIANFAPIQYLAYIFTINPQIIQYMNNIV